MFKTSNFCHIASNNRNEVKAGVFVYKTTDDLQTVLGRGYFNKKIIDLNLHDLIIHVQENNADKTVVQKNTLCVIGKTLDDVITDVIKSDWQESIEDAITELQHTDASLQTQITTNKNAIDEEITDRANADNALQGQITANANQIATNTGNIATLRNDVDGLGDQVSDIKGKIPQNATASNQLATKADLVNKQDTLVSGTNIKTVNGESLLGSGNVQIDAGGAMPVGAIFTTPRTGTIEGAVEANGGEYNIADYSGEGSIGALLTAGSIAYVSKTEFQTRVANTGACDSFGWDGTGDTTFLVPKLKPWHVGKSAPVIGNGTTVGLTDGTTNAGLGTNYTPSGYDVLSGTANYGADVGTTTTDGTLGAEKSIGITTDPTKSGMVADLSETANLRVMVQLATGATDQALETCTSVLSDVSALNAHRVIEFQAPTTENNYTWYRKYADGWVEQGGYVAATSTSTTGLAVTLPVAMADANYNVQKTIRKAASASSGFNFVWLADSESLHTNTTTTVYLSVLSISNALGVSWEVKGMSAQ